MLGGVEARRVPPSGRLSALQLLFEERRIRFAQGSRAIHFIMNGVTHSRDPGGAREHRGTKQQPQMAPPHWRAERGEGESATPQSGSAPSGGP